MKILLAFIFFLIVLNGIGKFMHYEDKDKILVYSIPLFFIAFNISFNGKIYRIVGEDLKYYINTATLLVIVIFLFLFNRNSIKRDKNDIFFILLFLNSIYHFYFLQDIADGPTFVRLSLNYLSILLCFSIAKSIKKLDLDTFLYSYNYLAIMNGFLGILQIITKKKLLIGDFNSSILYTQGVVDANRVVGIAGSNNSAGNLSAILFIIVLYNYTNKKDRTSLLALFLTLLFSLLTQTRVALLAIAIAGSLFYLLLESDTREEKLAKYSFSFIGISTVIMIFLIFQDKVIRTFFLNRGNTASERFNQLERAQIYSMKTHIWHGIGSGQWRSFLYNNYGIVDIPIHSQYLNFWVENGLIIFISFVILNIGILFSILKNTFIDSKIKKFILSLFISNIIVVNFNPNQIYTLNNILYYLPFFIIYNSKNNVINS